MLDKLFKKIDGFKSILGYGVLQFLDGKLWVFEAVKQVTEVGLPALSAALAQILLAGGLIHKIIKDAKAKS